MRSYIFPVNYLRNIINNRKTIEFYSSLFCLDFLFGILLPSIQSISLMNRKFTILLPLMVKRFDRVSIESVIISFENRLNKDIGHTVDAATHFEWSFVDIVVLHWLVENHSNFFYISHFTQSVYILLKNYVCHIAFASLTILYFT